MADKIAILDMDKPTAILNGRLYNAFTKKLDMDDDSSFESDIHSSPIEVQATTAKRPYRVTNDDTDQTNRSHDDARQ